MFSRRQAADSVHNPFSRESARFVDRQALNHFSQCGAARERGRTTVSEKPRSFDVTLANSQTQAQAIATDGIGFFSNGVRARQFACVTRMRDVILELF